MHDNIHADSALGIWCSAFVLEDDAAGANSDRELMRLFLQSVGDWFAKQGIPPLFIFDPGQVFFGQGVRMTGLRSLQSTRVCEHAVSQLLYLAGPGVARSAMDTLQRLSRAGVNVINTPASLKLCFSKSAAYAHFEGLCPIPEYVVLKTHQDIMGIPDALGMPDMTNPLIVKGDTLYGRGKVREMDLTYWALTEWSEQSRHALYCYLLKCRQAVGSDVVVQRMIRPKLFEGNSVRGLSVFVSGGDVLAALETRSLPCSWIDLFANRELAAAEVPTHVLQTVAALAQRAGLSFGKFDFFHGESGHVFLEVNPSPGSFCAESPDTVRSMAEGMCASVAPGLFARPAAVHSCMPSPC